MTLSSEREDGISVVYVILTELKHCVYMME